MSKLIEWPRLYFWLLRKDLEKKPNKTKAKINAFKLSKGCFKCGYNKCAQALDFHHIDPKQKYKGIAKLSNPIDLQTEIEKCVVVCKNCHTEIHHLKTF